ncbi:Prolyl oligopeptidase [Phytophthora megakarya]|uniref:Carboxylic ester hydrolase n=1 Tax=Phytophthora megakarya TaxID=4795 RepID=A0A225X0I7_9STRA|nr:Prolyl oligopeptidase [Phytophthora megakarya]
MSEDCLNLNVWTSADSVDDALPVYFWIYGGRFINGAGSVSLYDGAGLAAKGLVVVTINYRMGALGFLATSELQSESPNNSTGNYGLLDQIQALKWVHENIAAFGGDPTKVTIGGQSAGAASVYHLVDSPLSAGLFRGAIAESGIRFPNDPLIWALATSYRTFDHALDGGATYMANHNVSSAAELRNLSIESILNGNDDNDYYGTTTDADVGSVPPLFRPTLDGYVMPETYLEALENGPANDVALMTGNNADESGAATTTNVTVAEYVAAATEKYGDLVDEYLALYPANTDDEANNMTNNAARDISRVGSWLFGNYWAVAASSPFYTYFWSRAPPGQTAGAYHMSEINYCFNNLYDTDSPWEADDYAIADVMSSYWANFVKNLNPNGGNLTYWPASVATSNTTMHLDVTQEVMEIADSEKIDFIKKYFATQTPY